MPFQASLRRVSSTVLLEALLLSASLPNLDERELQGNVTVSSQTGDVTRGALEIVRRFPSECILLVNYPID